MPTDSLSIFLPGTEMKFTRTETAKFVLTSKISIIFVFSSFPRFFGWLVVFLHFS